MAEAVALPPLPRRRLESVLCTPSRLVSLCVPPVTNHSCDPSIAIVPKATFCEWKGVPWTVADSGGVLLAFALRDLRAGESVSFNCARDNTRSSPQRIQTSPNGPRPRADEPPYALPTPPLVIHTPMHSVPLACDGWTPL